MLRSWCRDQFEELGSSIPVCMNACLSAHVCVCVCVCVRVRVCGHVFLRLLYFTSALVTMNLLKRRSTARLSITNRTQ